MQSLLTGTLFLLTSVTAVESNLQTTLQPPGRFNADAVTATPTPPIGAPFSPPDPDVRCLSGIPIVNSIPTPAVPVREYLAENDVALPFQDCSLTAPASLTSGLASYQVEISSWLGTVKNPTITVGDLCGDDIFKKSYASFCIESFTVFASANGSAASASTVLPPMNNPGEITYVAGGNQLSPAAGPLLGAISLGLLLAV